LIFQIRHYSSKKVTIIFDVISCLPVGTEDDETDDSVDL
jgi:hypothetical protein